MPDLIPEAVEEVARKRVGPLPVGVWVVGAAVLVAVGAAILRKRRTGSASIPDADTEPAGESTTAGQTIPAQFTAVGSSTGTSSGTGIADPFAYTAPTVETNYDWRRRAETWAIGQGYPPSTVTTAVARFLDGSALTPQERAIVDAVLVAVGPTPEPTPPPIDQPTPTDSGSGTGEEPPTSEPTQPAGETWTRRDPDWLRTWGNLEEALDAAYGPGKVTIDQYIAALRAQGYYVWTSNRGRQVISQTQPTD